MKKQSSMQTVEDLALGPLHMSLVDWADSVTGMNFVFCSYAKFQRAQLR